VRRQDADLACFQQYLQTANVLSSGDTTRDITSDPLAWLGVSWGLVSGSVQWQVQQGYAIGSINARLSMVKSYCKLATQAGAVSTDEYARMLLAAGYRHAGGGASTRCVRPSGGGRRRLHQYLYNRVQAAALKQQADPLDRLLMCLLLDHGLRVGEVASLVRLAAKYQAQTADERCALASSCRT
jgi:hypothetical protein